MIPDGWSEHFLGDVCKISSGVGFPLKFQGRKDLPIPFIKVSDMNSEGNEKYVCAANNTIDNQIQEYIKAPIFPKGCLVLPKVGAALLTNKRRILAQPTAVDNNVMVLMSKSVNYEFLYYWSLLIDMADYVQSGALPSINKSTISQIKITLPPEKEQKKIAAILSSVDDAIQATQVVIDQTHTVKQGLLQQLLTRGIGHTRFKQTEIGEIPMEWELIPFDQVLDVRSGKGFRLDEYVDEGIKLLRIDNVSWGKITWDSIAYLPPHYADEYPELLLKEGDILLALNRPITQGKLKLAILKREDSPAILYQRVGKILFKNGSIKENFTYQLLNYLLPPFIMEKSVGSDQPFINITALKKLKLPIPTLKEQHKIVAILDNNDECIETHNKSLEYLFNIKRGLMQDLLTGRVRVKLDEVNTT